MINAIPEKLWPAVKVKGEIYALPNLQVEARWPGVLLLKKYVDKYNFDVTKLDDFTLLFTQIQRNEPGVIPFALMKNNFLTYMISNMGMEYRCIALCFTIVCSIMDDKIVSVKRPADLFEANLSQYKSADYDESNTLTNFIDKFFKMLIRKSGAQAAGTCRTERRPVAGRITLQDLGRPEREQA
ncbi:MAG: hypothetical protein LBG57_00040 [Treponema sp.]|jgi:hypothetical protein|nr:hypothetical protein [Treponema sp.]